MATTNKLWSFTSSAEGWTGYPATGDVVLSWQSGDGSPSAGCLQARCSGKNKNPGVSQWSITGTWADLFGVATGDTVTAVEKNDPSGLYKWACTEYVDGTGTNSVGPIEIWDSTQTVLLATLSNEQTSVTTTTAWAFASDNGQQAIPASYQAGNTTIWIHMDITTRTGNSTSAAVTMRYDTLDIKLTYTPYSAPTPSLVSGNIIKSKIFQSSIIR